VVKWQLVYAKQALKDAKKLSSAGLKEKVQELLEVLARDPFQNPPPFEKLVGDLEGALFPPDQHPTSLGVRGVQEGADRSRTSDVDSL